MKSLKSYGICSIVTLLTACGPSRSGSLTAPTAVTNPAPVPPAGATGEIRFAAVTQPSGGTLQVQDCGPSFTGIPGNHRCNDDWHAAFDVTSGVDLTNGVLTVDFEDSGRRCGEVSVGSQSFAAGRERLVGTSSPVYITQEGEGYDNLTVEQTCDLPVTTNRLIVQLWDPRKPATPLLRREFNYVSTFVSP
jgi:hypothetical protein